MGQLKPGQRVPSSRALAQQIGLARGTVMLAYEQMLLEGYFITRKGAGTFVADVIPESLNPSGASLFLSGQHILQDRSLSRRMLGQLNGPDKNAIKVSICRPFQPGLAPLDAFPRAMMARLSNTVYRSLPMDQLGFGEGAGFLPLREALAGYLGMTRGISCTPGQIIITTGSQQGFRLASQVLLDEGDAVWMEDPGYGGARVAFRQSGQRIVPVPLDAEGLQVDAGRAAEPDARLAYVTPAHQYPAAMTMSLHRRLDLINWAASNNSWILEDDYDGEFRYRGQPLETLQSLDPHQRVIYVGSLSKVLAPALRIGYLIVPPDLVEAFTFAKAASDRHTPVPLQAILAHFIEGGHFGRHLRRIRTLCKERQDVLIEAIDSHLNGRLVAQPDPAGLHLVGYLNEEANDRLISDAATKKSLTIPALSSYSTRHPMPPALILGYGSFTTDEIRGGIQRLASVIG